jgi:hypothetical protein
MSHANFAVVHRWKWLLGPSSQKRVRWGIEEELRGLPDQFARLSDDLVHLTIIVCGALILHDALSLAVQAGALSVSQPPTPTDKALADDSP